MRGRRRCSLGSGGDAFAGCVECCCLERRPGAVDWAFALSVGYFLRSKMLSTFTNALVWMMKDYYPRQRTEDTSTQLPFPLPPSLKTTPSYNNIPSDQNQLTYLITDSLSQELHPLPLSKDTTHHCLLLEP